MMPPAKKPRPTAAEREVIAHWIKSDVFGIDPQNPDPGRVTIRRLNRVDIHVPSATSSASISIPPANFLPWFDTSLGFDTIADTLTLPPMLLEKYLLAMQKNRR